VVALQTVDKLVAVVLEVIVLTHHTQSLEQQLTKLQSVLEELQ